MAILLLWNSNDNYSQTDRVFHSDQIATNIIHGILLWTSNQKQCNCKK